MSNNRFIVEFSVSLCSQERSQNDRRLCVTFPLLYVVQDVVATLFDERGRVVSSSCHAVVPRGRSVDLERMRKLEIQDVRRIRKEINYLNLPFGVLECSKN